MERARSHKNHKLAPLAGGTPTTMLANKNHDASLAPALKDDAWMFPANKPSLKHHTASLMSCVHGWADDPCPHDTVFSKSALLQLKPSDVKQQLCLRACRDAFPGPEDQPTNARASCLRRAKGRVSLFTQSRMSSGKKD